jgi:hypothetical protein
MQRVAAGQLLCFLGAVSKQPAAQNSADIPQALLLLQLLCNMQRVAAGQLLCFLGAVCKQPAAQNSADIPQALLLLQLLCNMQRVAAGQLLFLLSAVSKQPAMRNNVAVVHLMNVYHMTVIQHQHVTTLLWVSSFAS